MESPWATDGGDPLTDRPIYRPIDRPTTDRATTKGDRDRILPYLPYPNPRKRDPTQSNRVLLLYDGPDKTTEPQNDHLDVLLELIAEIVRRHVALVLVPVARFLQQTVQGGVHAAASPAAPSSEPAHRYKATLKLTTANETAPARSPACVLLPLLYVAVAEIPPLKQRKPR